MLLKGGSTKVSLDGLRVFLTANVTCQGGPKGGMKVGGLKDP